MHFVMKEKILIHIHMLPIDMLGETTNILFNLYGWVDRWMGGWRMWSCMCVCQSVMKIMNNRGTVRKTGIMEGRKKQKKRETDRRPYSE